VVSVALPAIQHDLGLSAGQLALVSSGYGLSFSGLLLLGGRLANLYGPRRMFTLGVSMFGVFSASSALAPGFGLLLAARFAQGIGAALAAPAAMALLANVFPDRAERYRAVAIWGGLSGIGATTGTVLSGVFAQYASWRWAFAVPVIATLPAMAAAHRLLPPDGPTGRDRLDFPGAVLATAGISALTYGLIERLPALPVLGVLLLVAFVVVESRTAAPLVPLSFFASRPRAVALAAIVLASAGMAGSFFFLSLYLQQDRGLSPLLTSAVFLPYGVVLLGTGAVAGRLLGRFGIRTVLSAGLMVAAAGSALVARFDGALFAGLLILPLGIGLTFAGATVAVVADVPDDQTGLAGGVVNTALEVGPTVGLAAGVSLAAGRTGGYGFALGIAAGAFLFASVAAASLLRPMNNNPGLDNPGLDNPGLDNTKQGAPT
jgi:MFS family permease